MDYLVEAETCLSRSISDTLRFAADESREQLLLNSSDYKTVRNIMQTIADKFNGSMTVHATALHSEMKEQQFKYELRIKDLEHMVEVLQERVQYMSSEKEKRTSELLHQTEKQLIEERSKAEKLQQQLDSLQRQTDMQFEITELRYASRLAQKERDLETKTREIEEQSRCINELEETNRRLSKFPDVA